MNVRIIDLPKIVDPRGNLTVAEQMKNVPFDIARVYWTYDVPSGERRGGHAHRTNEEIVIAVSGSLDVKVFDALPFPWFVWKDVRFDRQTGRVDSHGEDIDFCLKCEQSGIPIYLDTRVECEHLR